MRVSGRAALVAALVGGCAAARPAGGLCGVVDRVEASVAVLEVGGRERVVPRSALPTGARPGDVLRDGRVDRAATARARAAARALLERLRRAPPDFGAGDRARGTRAGP